MSPFPSCWVRGDSWLTYLQDFRRDGADIHIDNPAEELNFRE